MPVDDEVQARYYRRLQAEEPVHFSTSLQGWVVTRYDDVRLVLRDPRFSAERIPMALAQSAPELRAAADQLFTTLGLWLVFRDPPDHTRLRALLSKAFTPRTIEGMRPAIETLTDALIGELPDRGEIDLISSFAYPLPVSVVARMLGVEDRDYDAFKRWSDHLSQVVLRVFSTKLSQEQYANAEHAVAEYTTYFESAIAHRRAAPKDDLLTALISAEEGGSVLSVEEIVSTSILLLFAGHETTTNLIANGIYLLLRHPTELERLRRDRTLIESAVEELLRFMVGGALARFALEDVELHGVRIKAGDRVFAMVDAANRDPTYFEDPDRFDIGRRQSRNVSFGAGMHACIGAPLARLEGQIAIGKLLERFEVIELATDDLEWIDSLTLRRLAALPIRVER